MLTWWLSKVGSEGRILTLRSHSFSLLMEWPGRRNCSYEKCECCEHGHHYRTHSDHDQLLKLIFNNRTMVLHLNSYKDLFSTSVIKHIGRCLGYQSRFYHRFYMKINFFDRCDIPTCVCRGCRDLKTYHVTSQCNLCRLNNTYLVHDNWNDHCSIAIMTKSLQYEQLQSNHNHYDQKQLTIFFFYNIRNFY